MTNIAWLSLTDLRGGAALNVVVGDLVRNDQGYHPQFQVIAVNQESAWIRDTRHGSNHIVSVDQCRKIEVGGG